MAKHDDKDYGCEEDGCADVFAAVALIALFVSVMSYWLHSMT